MEAEGASAPFSETTPTLLPGQSPPLTVVTATNQTGVVIIGAVLALIFAVISMFIRLFIRSKFQNEFARDDLAALIALVSANNFSRHTMGGGLTLMSGKQGLFVIQSGLLFGQVSFGFAKTIEDISATGLVELQRVK